MIDTLREALLSLFIPLGLELRNQDAGWPASWTILRLQRAI